ncbi:MAG TPA: lactoylglutathione lyase [Candidatus Binataceae bacterium]|jgi:lactoylglutathione lyase|nr:lactoylglutathione lyase [Candidatus Binataceae bacterium]
MQLLHTMIRVNDLDESLKFYCDKLGMKLLRKNDFPGGKFTLAFVGYGDEKNHTVVELTHNWDTHKYDIGTAFGHLAIGVPDAFKACEELKQKGVKVVREAGPMQHGDTVIAFIEDPNGYKIELIQQRSA